MKKEFREFILKGQEIFIGLEDSKKTWKLCVRSQGIIAHEASMPAKYEVLVNYLKKNYPDCKISIIYEAGFRGFGLHDKITADGWECIVTPPHTVTDEKCQKQKNDRIDCRRLAKNLENKDYKSCAVPDKRLREDRQISRSHEQVSKDIKRVCNRIRRNLEFHDLDEKYPAGRWSRRNYMEFINSIKSMELSESLRFSFDIYIRELQILWGFKKELNKKLKELATAEKYKDNIKLLESVPGIGPLTAARLILEWGDLERFKRKESFSKFLGLIPGEFSSGERDRKGHISKQGNGSVRSWLVLCSWIAIRHDPVLLEKYNNIANRCGSKKKAIIAVARKLAIRIRAVLLSKEPYAIGVVV